MKTYFILGLFIVSRLEAAPHSDVFTNDNLLSPLVPAFGVRLPGISVESSNIPSVAETPSSMMGKTPFEMFITPISQDLVSESNDIISSATSAPLNSFRLARPALRPAKRNNSAPRNKEASFIVSGFKNANASSTTNIQNRHIPQSQNSFQGQLIESSNIGKTLTGVSLPQTSNDLFSLLSAQQNTQQAIKINEKQPTSNSVIQSQHPPSFHQSDLPFQQSETETFGVILPNISQFNITASTDRSAQILIGQKDLLANALVTENAVNVNDDVLPISDSRNDEFLGFPNAGESFIKNENTNLVQGRSNFQHELNDGKNFQSDIVLDEIIPNEDGPLTVRDFIMGLNGQNGIVVLPMSSLKQMGISLPPVNSDIFSDSTDAGANFDGKNNVNVGKSASSGTADTAESSDDEDLSALLRNLLGSPSLEPGDSSSPVGDGFPSLSSSSTSGDSLLSSSGNSFSSAGDFSLLSIGDSPSGGGSSLLSTNNGGSSSLTGVPLSSSSLSGESSTGTSGDAISDDEFIAFLSAFAGPASPEGESPGVPLPTTTTTTGRPAFRVPTTTRPPNLFRTMLSDLFFTKAKWLGIILGGLIDKSTIIFEAVRRGLDQVD